MDVWVKATDPLDKLLVGASDTKDSEAAEELHKQNAAANIKKLNLPSHESGSGGKKPSSGDTKRPKGSSKGKLVEPRRK
jgi:hypothetical protein